jgi:Domain of unknown function (DUF5668)
MNHWYQLRRMRGAAFLILVGVLALLNQWNILSWDKSWPFFLILAGLLALVERAAWTADIRARQAAQEFSATAGPGPGTIPSSPGAAAYWAAEPLSNADGPRVEPNPPASSDSDREGR